MSQLSCGCLVPRPFKRVRLALGRWGRGLVTGHRFMLTCFNTGLGTHHGATSLRSAENDALARCLESLRCAEQSRLENAVIH